MFICTIFDSIQKAVTKGGFSYDTLVITPSSPLTLV